MLLHIVLILTACYMLYKGDMIINACTQYTDARIRAAGVMLALLGLHGIYIGLVRDIDMSTALTYVVFTFYLYFDRRRTMLKINSVKRCY